DFMHQLTRCVGADERLVVDYSQGELQCGDVFVLLSDGVHGMLGEAQLRRMLRDGLAGGSPAQALSEALVQGAAAKGGRDDATALVLRLQGASEATLRDEQRQSRTLPAPARLKVGDMLDGLAVTALVADNGIHLLYQVREPRSRRLYALKTLNPKRAFDPEERATLAHEAWLAKRMQSGRAGEHLVHLQTVPPAGGTPSAFYLVYDWHSGETLQQMLDRKHRFTAQQSVEVVRQVAHALGRMHRQGVIHRDIKPANLHRGDDGVVRVLDLGVALSGREPPATRALHAGTPSYINPEQWGFGTAARGGAAPEPPDAQSDLFALGVTLYQLLTGGRLPYGEVVPYQVGRYRRDPVAPSRHDPQVPIWLDHVALKAVALDKRQRFETAEEFLLALERGAPRALPAPPASPLLQRDRVALWKIGLAVSVLLNLLLVYWLLFLPR
ncbi:MAG: protein serine/threonine phosphatase, partial [Variovorax sp.]|nr:protein serine/threonine phosphatase [Variovorax sp.]